MSQRQLKCWYFAIEALNSLATVYYLYYLYFFFQQAYGFSNQANLIVAAANGVLYMVGSWSGGKFAHRFGRFTSLKLGFSLMAAAMGAGLLVTNALGHVALMALTVVGTCFTWPALEALLTEDEPPAGVRRMVGLYNVVWAFTAAFAFFSGGALLQRAGFRSLFYGPATILVGQLGLTIWLERMAALMMAKPGLPRPGAGEGGVSPSGQVARHPPGPRSPSPSSAEPAGTTPPPLNPRPIAKARMFLRMAWLANPFAYVALNTLIAVMPGVAKNLGLSTMLAGFCCSIWCFARLAAFVLLFLWDGWHYRFRWLLAAFVMLAVTFAVILMVPNLAAVLLAELGFGAALGLIYSSSLFYSMDLSEAKSEHGGIHEAAIGLGNFVGPAVGAGSAYLLPQYASSGPLAVSGLLVLGLGGLLLIWRKGR